MPLMFEQLKETAPVGVAVCPFCCLIGRDVSPRAQLLNNGMVWCLSCARVSTEPLPFMVRPLLKAPWSYRNVVASFLSVSDTLVSTQRLPRPPFVLQTTAAEEFRCHLHRDGEAVVLTCSQLLSEQTPSYCTFTGEPHHTRDLLGAHNFLGKYEPGSGGTFERICKADKLRMKAQWVML